MIRTTIESRIAHHFPSIVHSYNILRSSLVRAMQRPASDSPPTSLVLGHSVAVHMPDLARNQLLSGGLWLPCDSPKHYNLRPRHPGPVVTGASIDLMLRLRPLELMTMTFEIVGTQILFHDHLITTEDSSKTEYSDIGGETFKIGTGDA